MLLAQNLLHLSDFLLNFSCELLCFALGLEVGIVHDLSGFLLHFSLQVVEIAFQLVFVLGFVNVAPAYTIPFAFCILEQGGANVCSLRDIRRHVD